MGEKRRGALSSIWMGVGVEEEELRGMRLRRAEGHREM